ncbi:MAG: hypothetical protein JWN28_138 [Candidatus Saccharibacteria bacterium]|nr:hypothetical protein [Candidatus Saccharibacteria bacterium]
MAEIEQPKDVNVAFERQILESESGTRQRLLAEQALFQVSEFFDAVPTESQLELIRGLSKQRAKAARIALELTVQLLDDNAATNQNNVIELPPLVLVENPSTEPAEADAEVEKEAEHEVVISQDGQLAERVIKFLQDIDRYDESATRETINDIIEKLIKDHSPTARQSKLDYPKMLNMYFDGFTNQEIAEGLHTTNNSIRVTMSRIRKEAQQKALKENTPETIAETVQKPTVYVSKEPIAKEPIIEEPIVEAVVVEAPEVQTEQEIKVEAVPEVLEVAEVVVVEEVVVEEEAAIVYDPKETYKKVMLAVEKPEEVLRDEWLQVAEAYIKNAASAYLDIDEAEALWAHLHFDEDYKYRQTPRRYRGAISILRPLFQKQVHDRFKKDSINKKVLGYLFGNPDDPKNLDDLKSLLEDNKDGDVWTKLTVQRQAVAAFSELLQS